MPTAAKLVAAVLFALISAYAAHVYIPALPEGTQVASFRQITAGIGFLSGWMVMGNLVGKGYGEAIGSGIRTTVTSLFFAVLLFSIAEMLHRTGSMLYKGPIEAILAIFDLALYYGKLMGTTPFLTVLAVGSVLGGVVPEWVGRRWR